MKFISILFYTCTAMVAYASGATQVKGDPFTSSELDEAYQFASRGIGRSAEAREALSLDQLKKDIELQSKSITTRLGIEVPWLSELVFQSVIAYIPINEDDAWLEKTFVSHEPLEKLLSQGYDFCQLKFKKWDHTGIGEEEFTLKHSIAPDLGTLEEGVVLSKGVLYIIKRKVHFYLSDTDYETFYTFENIAAEREMYHHALSRLDKNGIDDERWQRVVTLLTEYPQALYHPKSLTITRVKITESDYSALLNILSVLQVKDQKPYSIEQVLLGEQIYTGGQVSYSDFPWQYVLYGFNSKIDGISCRYNIEEERLDMSTYTWVEDFLRLIISNTK